MHCLFYYNFSPKSVHVRCKAQSIWLKPTAIAYMYIIEKDCVISGQVISNLVEVLNVLGTICKCTRHIYCRMMVVLKDLMMVWVWVLITDYACLSVGRKVNTSRCWTMSQT